MVCAHGWSDAPPSHAPVVKLTHPNTHQPPVRARVHDLVGAMEQCAPAPALPSPTPPAHLQQRCDDVRVRLGKQPPVAAQAAHAVHLLQLLARVGGAVVAAAAGGSGTDEPALRSDAGQAHARPASTELRTVDTSHRYTTPSTPPENTPILAARPWVGAVAARLAASASCVVGARKALWSRPVASS